MIKEDIQKTPKSHLKKKSNIKQKEERDDFKQLYTKTSTKKSTKN